MATTSAASDSSAAKPDRLVRTATLFALAGFFCILLFLIFGFKAWSVGVGVFLGFPLLIVAVVLYVLAVIRDLRHREAL